MWESSTTTKSGGATHRQPCCIVSMPPQARPTTKPIMEIDKLKPNIFPQNCRQAFLEVKATLIGSEDTYVYVWDL
ncbi:hypothetical protein E2562_009296 [Oryza meyeriana var. granulata]|uniref:Uncharacterized protein n=1 Tax=Oryza meyeriana var. granulata TaxID=110450 RepID=A0A6G1E8W9_9ORYZ|nr:hypothetical protein E2562_009296 [Oryza meyeriana var. granulata]